MRLDWIYSYSKATVLALIFCNTAFAQQDLTGKSHVVRVNLTSVDFFEAKIDLEFHLAENIKSAVIGYDIAGVTRGYAPLKIHSGDNHLSLFVSRDLSKAKEIETSHIEITAYQGDITYFKEDVPVLIHWPGPEYSGRIAGFSSVKHLEFSGIDKVRVNRNLEYADRLIEKLLSSGFPVEKISIFRPRDGAASNNLVLSKYLDLESAKNMVNIFVSSSESNPRIKFGGAGGRHRSGEVYVGSGEFISSDYMISGSDFKALKNPGLSTDNLVNILDLDIPDQKKNEMAMYEEARDLINTGSKGNLQRAKVMLDELVNSNPNFHQAYLELARYHMKVDWPRGLKKAKQLILLAKDIEPKYADTYVLLGYVDTNLGEFDKADEEYKLAANLGTDNLWLYANWGLNYERQGLESKAVEKYLYAVHSKNNSKNNLLPREWILNHSKLFQFLINSKAYKKADQLYEIAAEGNRYRKCSLQKQAELRAYYMNWYEGAIESYFKSRKMGCSDNSPVLSIAYFMKWSELKEKGGDSQEISANLRRAEAAAPSDKELFFGLASSDNTAKLIPEMEALGKNVNYIDPNGMSALLEAVKDKDVKRARRLLDHGADVNIRSVNEYYRPIVYATYLKDVEMIKLLLEFHAETYIEIEKGLYLEDFARKMGLQNVAESFAVKISS